MKKLPYLTFLFSHKNMRWLLLLAIVFPCLIILSCKDKNSEKDMLLADPAPVEINFYVEDSEGNDLLDPENPNAFGPEDITITCTEQIGSGTKTYHVGAYNGNPERNQWFDVIVTPYFLDKNLTQKKYVVSIGNYYSQYLASMPVKTVEIAWPDGTKDEIVLTYSEYRMDNGLLMQNVHIFLNGVEMPYPYPFTIVK